MWNCQACKANLGSPEAFGKHEIASPQCKTHRLSLKTTGWQSVELDGIPTIIGRRGEPKTKQEQELFKQRWLSNAP